MKALHALLIVLLISLYNAVVNEPCDPDGKTTTAPNELKDCKDRTLPTGYARCCYHYEKYFSGGKFTDRKYCRAFKQTEFEKFVSIYKSRKGDITSNGGSIDTLEWNCSSNYIYISLLSLMIFLL